MLQECVNAASSITGWEGFLGGVVFAGIIAAAYLSKKAKDVLTPGYTIETPDGKKIKRRR